MKNRLAIMGGKKVRKSLMPSRFAFGSSENSELKKMMKYYKSKNEDPKYSGLWEDKFCNLFSKFLGGGFTDAVATGTGAIFIAMKALELPKNSEVIICPVTCSGNLSCITEQGHKPILVDSEKNSYNVSLKKIKEKFTKKIKLIQLTHAAGEPVKDIKQIAQFARKNKVYLLEDCSQAIGASVNGKKVGTFGDVAAFSTMYRKNLAANSSGGLVYTKNKKLFKKILAYGDRGKILWNKKLDLRDPKHSLFPALNWNTDEFSCAIGLANLKRLRSTNSKRNQFLKKLIKKIKLKSKVCSPYAYNQGFAPFYFPIFVNEKKIKVSKIKFAKALSAEGIGVGEHYGCIVSTWPWAKSFFKKGFKSMNAINTRNSCFHLYLNENYKDREINDIIKAINKVENYYLKKYESKSI
jgi:perosamine synthetase